MPSLRDLITDPALDLTPAERKVIRALLDQYPRNGLAWPNMPVSATPPLCGW
jgi:hypothetical protein